ncbi:hypothetical protein ER308_06630 [Egibacter rhizosphaerae]|uniref:Cyclodeaminase/cyclohydrolase domain-containing protein n=1 Tax=Egibacter rhizosphaerae TaxID=1670831 RepID=A0A411YDI7_9ACTN|nr:cyclodeaminase/cyclohydrolase family protein [Egibacter rhizosphaerae]QBI19248.1 hypothetical protein ER308_06630 [Egibacter rhizosphaerae]
METELASRSVTDVLKAVAGEAPTPAAGSSAALVVGFAASLVSKCARKAVGRIEEAHEILERAEVLRGRAEQLAEADAGSYHGVVAANRGEGSLADALSAASDTPLAIAEVGAELADAAAELAGRGKPWLRGDAHTAALLAEAGTRAAVMLVHLNLRDAGIGPRHGDPRGERGRWLAAAAGEARARSGAAVESRSVR